MVVLVSLDPPYIFQSQPIESPRYTRHYRLGEISITVDRVAYSHSRRGNSRYN